MEQLKGFVISNFSEEVLIVLAIVIDELDGW
jgi:hypothetical protein